MKLTAFVNQYMSGAGAPLHTVGRGADVIHRIIRNEGVTAPTIGTIFWQAFIYSTAFDELLFKLFSNMFDVRRPQAPGVVREYINFFRHGKVKNPFMRYFLQGERFQGPPVLVLRHSKSNWPRYDLILFLPAFQNFKIRDPVVVDRVDVSPSEILEGWKTFVHRFPWPPRHSESEDKRLPVDLDEIPRELPRDDNDIITAYGAQAAVEAYEAQPFGVMLISPPKTIPLSASVMTAASPSPAIPVSPTQGGSPVSSAGVVARNKQGIIGVTTALHALPKKGRTEVWVNGSKGTIISRDKWSDSCFIEVPGISTTALQTSSGPLEKAPRNNDEVHFDGVTSGKKDTIVTGWDPRLPRCEKNGQYVVITEPDTDPGDSGAALIDSDDKLVGFAHKRTGFNERIEYAEWIWARSVLEAHSLR